MVETTTESFAAKLQKAAVSNGLDIRVREKAGTSMKQKMCRSDLNPGSHAKVWKDLQRVFPNEKNKKSPHWLAKDVVYQVKCVRCSECYTGETSIPLHKRMYNHWYGLRGEREEESALTQHYLDRHRFNDETMPMMLELVSLTKTCGFVERKTMESVVQATTSSSINRRVEGAGTVGNLYL